MKKKPNVRTGERSVLKKICTVMKLCLFLLLITIYSVSAKSVAQNFRLSMEKKSESLVKVLNELGEKSGYEFFYNDDEVTDIMSQYLDSDAASHSDISLLIVEDNADMLHFLAGYFQILRKQKLILINSISLC